MKSVLLIGQSNMAGRGFTNQVEPIIDERIFVLRNGRWQMMDEPIHSDRAVAGIGPAASFAKMWVDAHPNETIGLIPCADGGTSIDEWAKDQMLTRHAIAETQFAMESSDLIGILWHQGESDSLNGNYATYSEKLKGLIDSLRETFNKPECPFVMGLLGDYLGQQGFGLSAPEFQHINTCIQEVAQQKDNCYFVTAQALTPNPDGIHIDALSQRKFGMRYYKAFNERSNVDVPLNGEENIESKLTKKKYTKNEKMYMLIAKLSRNQISYEDFEKQMQSLY
ncbi:sialate O-acetylesterase [Staphylococcus sp. HKU1]|uniref:sialate O-acetylesterase n=1 Tax=Staphylococcus sp. HKU1 TaxID=3068989 RepID=UPI003AAE7844